MNEYTTVKEPFSAELVIKKSRFIGQIYPAASFEEAGELLETVKKKYWDATHNCSAMIIGEKGEFSRCSDDGEPQGTAGVPMLEALKHSGLTNVLAIVTRYFGGTLLGAGGLVRAYTQSVAEAVKGAQRILRKPYCVFEMELPFPLWGKAEAKLLDAGHKLKDTAYTSCVQAAFYVEPKEREAFLKLMAELSAGKVVPRENEAECLEINLN